MPLFQSSGPVEATLATLAEALDMLDVGIVLVNRDLCVRFVNRRYAEIWAGSAELVETEPSFRALLEHSATQLRYDVPTSAPPDHLGRREAEVRAGAIAPTEIDLNDGRRLLFRCMPTRDGGRILTYADITRLKQMQEQQQQACDAVERSIVEQRFSTETLESQAAYLATLAESADENARRAEEARRQLEREIAERRQLEARLRRMATTDSLTGTLNRAQFLELGERELERTRRLGQGLAVLMLDIDHFKAINDRFGHHAGDEALKHFVARLQSGVRRIDLLGRLGGEEFAIVAPGAAGMAARQIAERLRARVATAPLALGHRTIGITVSIGVAMARDADGTLDPVLARADAALYGAKRGGRNRVLSAGMPADEGCRRKPTRARSP